MTYNEGLQKLRDLHINTPEVICAFPQSETEDRAGMINAILKATAKRLTCDVVVRTIGSEFQGTRNTGPYPISPGMLQEFIKNFSNLGSYITILKALKSKYEIRGFCVPGPHYNKFTSISDFVKQDYKAVTVWGQSMDEYPFPVGIRKPVRLVNEMLVNNRMILDGMELEFTYHLEPEGSMQQNIVFWGMRSPNYIGE